MDAVARKLVLALAGTALVGCAPEAGQAKGPPKGPFAVSDYFAASGAMGDGATPPRLTINEKNAACKVPRPPGARGNCFAFVYDPKLETTVTPPTQSVLWAGLYWQYPANNWGDLPGLPLPTGLSRVTLQAAVADGTTEMVELAAGGIGFPPATDANAVDYPHDDTFRASIKVGLNDQWSQLEIPLNATPSELIGAFTWALSYPDGTDLATAAPKTLFIDDLYYQ